MSNELEIIQADQLVKIEMDTQIATAKQYPRDEKKVLQKIHYLATIDKEIAASCFYAKPVGDGKVATGESIRFAEIAASVWGNLRIRTYLKEESQKTVVAVGEIHDLETNTAISTEVSRSIWGKYGRYGESTIEVTKLAAQAIARRNIIMQVIPKGLLNSTLQQIKDCATGKNDEQKEKYIKQTVAKYVKSFQQKGITETQLCQKLEISHLDEIDSDKLEILIGFGTAIKEGMTVQELFEIKDERTTDLIDSTLKMNTPNEKKD